MAHQAFDLDVRVDFPASTGDAEVAYITAEWYCWTGRCTQACCFTCTCTIVQTCACPGPTDPRICA